MLKGLINGYNFDMSLLKQLVNVKGGTCIRAKITDEKHIGTLYTSTIPWRTFAMDMQASIKGNMYQCIIIDTYSKYVWTYFIITKDEVYNILSDLCETEIVKLWGELRTTSKYS